MISAGEQAAEAYAQHGKANECLAAGGQHLVVLAQSRRDRFSQPKVRSTIQRHLSSTKPLLPGGREMICSTQRLVRRTQRTRRPRYTTWKPAHVPLPAEVATGLSQTST